MKQQFKQGAAVVKADGQQVGHLDRVVIDPRTQEITDLIVRKGFLFTRDKVLSASYVATASPEVVILRDNSADLDGLPDFEETHYVPVEQQAHPRSDLAQPDVPPVYWYPPHGLTMPSVADRELPMTVQSQVERNIPEGTVALSGGAKVIASDQGHVGNVERVLTDPTGKIVTHFLVSRGLFRREHKLIPVMWVDSTTDTEIYLLVTSSVIERLPEYQNV